MLLRISKKLKTRVKLKEVRFAVQITNDNAKTIRCFPDENKVLILRNSGSFRDRF
jgi:phosphoheptose isomerase